MITAIVLFDLPPSIGREQVIEDFQTVAPYFRTVPGLLRKAFLYDGRRAGGVYLWESRDAAERAYSGPVRAMIRERYGVEPEIAYFETPVVIDSMAAEAVSTPPIARDIPVGNG